MLVGLKYLQERIHRGIIKEEINVNLVKVKLSIKAYMFTKVIDDWQSLTWKYGCAI